MANNQTVSPPDFDRIRRGNFIEIADGMKTLWSVANTEARDRRLGVRAAIERIEPKYLVSEPAANQNNFNTDLSTILRFDGTVAVNVTGLQARVEGAIVIVMVIGSATITFKHNDGASEARNRILTFSGGDLAVVTNKSAMFAYLNTRWRELKWA